MTTAPSQATLERAMRHMGEGVFLVDEAGRCIFVNPAGEQLLGLSRSQIVGCHMHDLLHRDDTMATPHRREECQITAALRRMAETFVGKASLLRPDGESIEVEVQAYPFEDDGGRPAVVMTCTDVSAMRRLQEESVFRRALLDAQTEASLDGILVVAADTRMVSFNQRFIDLWGVPADVVASRSDEAALNWVLRKLMDPDAFIRKVVYLYEHPDEHSRDTIPLKDGRVLDRYSAPVKGPDGVYHGRVWFFRDVSDLVRAQHELARLYDEAQGAIRLRDTFLSVASHELKTPLTSLLLHVQNVERRLEQEGTEVPRDWLKGRIAQASRYVRRLGGLIDDLLDIARISSGRLQFQLEQVDLGEVVREVASRQEAAAEAAGCAMTLVIAQSVVGRWDRARLDQVVTNLVANAVKYGRGRPIEISVSDTAEAARLTVADQGIGIAPVDHARIFERFERVTTGADYGGFGVGLWVVRQIVTALGGDIQVTSQPAKGAIFTVTLPVGGAGTEVELSDAAG